MMMFIITNSFPVNNSNNLSNIVPSLKSVNKSFIGDTCILNKKHYQILSLIAISAII